MSVKVREYLQFRFLLHAPVLAAIETIPVLRPRKMPLPEAVVRVVVGQMLSSKAARSIYARVNGLARQTGMLGSWR